MHSKLQSIYDEVVPKPQSWIEYLAELPPAATPVSGVVLSPTEQAGSNALKMLLERLRERKKQEEIMRERTEARGESRKENEEKGKQAD